jgi:hypothetical protein
MDFSPIHWQLLKETELHVQVDGFLKAGKGDTKYKCPNCDVEYFSRLLMAFHQFNNHAILTQQQRAEIAS